MMGMMLKKGIGSVRGKTISKKAYAELSACWDVLDQSEKVVGKPLEARIPQ
jgi:hypothetical protein